LFIHSVPAYPEEAVVVYIVCKFWPDQGYSSGRRRGARVEVRAQHRLAPATAPALPTLVSTVLVPPELPKAA